MKKKCLLVLPLLLGFASCNGGEQTSDKKDYVIATFNLNYDVENDVYLNQIVKSEQVLLEPSEPNRIDYVFDGWYEDETCLEKFTKFDEVLEQDITLYASWIPYESIEDYEKIDRFINKINDLSGNVCKADIVESGVERYYSPTDFTYPFYQEMEYNRYQDITTVDYYDEGRNNKVASQQYFYQNGFLYNIFNDIEESGKNNEVQKAPIEEEELASYIDIDFISLFGSLLERLSTQLKEGYSSDELDYEFTLNYTRVNEYDLTYSFELNYYTYQETIDLGAVEEIYMMDFGLTFVNGMIKRSTVTQQYMFGIQGEVQYLIEDTLNASYELCDGYQNFQGQKYNPSDFEN